MYLMYLRKSRADSPYETVEEVLARHERQLQDFSEKTFGKKIEEEYIFREVVSGETIDNRPEMQKILSMIESPRIKGVLVIDAQRLSRGDWGDGGKILNSFRYSNTLIITPTKTYNLTDRFDYRFFKMELSQGNEYLEYVKETLKRGKLASVKEGNYIGSVAPYGYKKVVIDGQHTLEPFEPEAQTIRIAVNLKLDSNRGWTYVAHELDRLGYPPRNGGYWSPYTLRDICINPVNIGLIKWNTRKVQKTYTDGEIKISRPRNYNQNEVLLIPGKHPGILDETLFNQLISVASPTPRNKVSSTLKNPFSGLLFCGKCKKAMIYREYKKHGIIKSSPRLLCSNQVHCGIKSSSFSEVYETVIHTLEKIVSDFEIYIGNNTTDSSLQKQLLTTAQREMKKLDEQQNELYDLLETKIYSKDLFLERNKKLQVKRKDLQKQINNLESKINTSIDYSLQISKFRDVINTLLDSSVSADSKNMLLKTIIKRMDYYRDSSPQSKIHIKIELKDF